jgi:hypothetical protein
MYRVSDHEREARSGKPSKKCRLIREIWDAGYRIERRIIRRFSDEAAALDFEYHEIERIGLSNLTNMIPGGFGITGTAYKERPTDISIVRLFFTIMRFTKSLDAPFTVMVHGVEVEIPGKLLCNVRRWMREILHKRGKDWVLKKAGRATA